MMMMKLMMEVLCYTGVSFIASLIMAALLHRRPASTRALRGSCYDKGHHKRYSQCLTMKKSKDVLLVGKVGRNSYEYSKWISVLNGSYRTGTGMLNKHVTNILCA
jgi:hypothetical protein